VEDDVALLPLFVLLAGLVAISLGVGELSRGCS
jgi:hypothetical protein